MKASARKSKGRYKPVIVHDNGRTEILGQRERPLLWRGKEALPGGPTRGIRGKTFATREEAVAAALAVIEKRAAHRDRVKEEAEARRARAGQPPTRQP